MAWQLGLISSWSYRPSDAQKFLHGSVTACGAEDDGQRNNGEDDAWREKGKGKDIKKACP